LKNEIKRITKETARKRNEKILVISNKIMIGYKSKNGQLEKLLNGIEYEQIAG